MIGFPATASPVLGGLFGSLRSWLRTWSRETWPASDDPQLDGRGNVDRANGPVRVLVVDDDPVNLMVISAQMKLLGLEPMLAGDGAEAVALACELHFDLILVDLQMPVLDGLGASAAIRRFEAVHSRPAIPVVAFSSSTMAASFLADHGISGSLAKPCEALELEACLVRMCPAYRRRGPTSPDIPGDSRWQRPGASRASLR